MLILYSNYSLGNILTKNQCHLKIIYFILSILITESLVLQLSKFFFTNLRFYAESVKKVHVLKHLDNKK